MSEPDDEPAPGRGALPLNRSEALADGIFAVAMTLLVIDLKLPEQPPIADAAALTAALVDLLPKAGAWLLSFFVLAFFWMGHHRVFSQLRGVDERLLRLGLVELALVSLMPFSSSLIGEHAFFASQVVYSTNLALLSLLAWLIVRHVHRHPALSRAPTTRAHYLATSVRVLGVAALGLVSIGVAAWDPGSRGLGNWAYALMALVMPLSRRLEARLSRPPASAAADA